jgi:hypothetical protein
LEGFLCRKNDVVENVVFTGVLQKMGCKTWCFCMVNVVSLWWLVWLEVPLKLRQKMRQVLEIYFRDVRGMNVAA